MHDPDFDKFHERAGTIFARVRGTKSATRVFGGDRDDRTPKIRAIYFPPTA
jgi:hypothetical protein